ncbi:MAG: cardiolipin synthase ClsB [Burkholderiales bacterium]|nr:cardiolipin synthase ClsB [Burkholderiales bacterium]
MEWTHGNQLVLLRNGEAYFPALCNAISQAQREIFMESYLYRDDRAGELVSRHLIAAARRGVRVQLLLDGFGAGDMPDALRERLVRGGVRLLFFRPDYAKLSFSRQRLRRLHRKLVVIDGSIGFVGGINVIDDETEAGLAPRYDYALQIGGPLVADLRAIAAQQWRHSSWVQLKRDWARLPHAPAVPIPQGEVNARLVRRDNLRHRRDIEAMYLAAINSAHEEIILAHAYFLPGMTFRRALLAAAKRGVRIVLLLQGRIDHALLYYATRVLYRPLLKAGVEIHEYHAGFMHAKVCVVDRFWFTVGSSNIDPFSLLTAREANVEARDAHLAGELRASIEERIVHDAAQVTQTPGMHRPWQRALPWLAYQMVRLLLGLTGYGRREYRE